MRVIAAIALVGLALVASTRANHNDNDDEDNGRPRRTYIMLYKKGECVDDTAIGHTQFYYINSAPYSITVSINRNGNRMMPGAYNQGQPTVFLPGQHDAHNVTFSCEPDAVGILQWIVPENNVDHRAIATCSQVPCKPLCCDSVQTIFTGPGIGVAFSGRNATITNTAPQNPLDISSIVAGAGISVARSGATVTITNSAQEYTNDVANIIAGAGVSASRSGNDVTLALSNPYVGACAVDTCPPASEDCKQNVCVQLSQTRALSRSLSAARPAT